MIGALISDGLRHGRVHHAAGCGVGLALCEVVFCLNAAFGDVVFVEGCCVLASEAEEIADGVGLTAVATEGGTEIGGDAHVCGTGLAVDREDGVTVVRDAVLRGAADAVAGKISHSETDLSTPRLETA